MTNVALSCDSDGNAVLLAEVTDNGHSSDYPVEAGKLVLPASPSEIDDDWLPGLSSAAKEVAWQLLDVIRQANHWGTVSVTQMCLHLLADSRRPAGSQIGFRHHPIVGDSDWEALGIFRDSSAELAGRGYVERGGNNTFLTPTPDLARAVNG